MPLGRDASRVRRLNRGSAAVQTLRRRNAVIE